MRLIASTILLFAAASAQADNCLGDRVWLDENADGVQQRAEPGIAGAVVSLVDGSGDVIDSMSTNYRGYFELCGPAGPYTFQVNVPEGLEPTVQMVGTSWRAFYDDSNIDDLGVAQVRIREIRQLFHYDAGLRVPEVADEPEEPEEPAEPAEPAEPEEPADVATADIRYDRSSAFTRSGDINGDGVEDAVIGIGTAAHNDPAFIAWFDGRTGARTDITTRNLEGYIGDVAVVDMDSDGDLDVALANGPWLRTSPGSGSVEWYEQTATGWTRRLIAQGVPGHHFGEIRVADMDADGDMDVVVRQLGPFSLRVYWQGSGGWSPQFIRTQRREGLDVADLDADDLPEIIINGIVYFNDGARAFTERAIDLRWYTQDQGRTHLVDSTKSAAADIDGDGRVDLVIGQAEGIDQPLIWYRAPANPRTGPWVPTQIDSSIRTHQVLARDADSDGDIDIIGGESWSGTHRYRWINDGVGSFRRETLADDAGCYNCDLINRALVGPTGFAEGVVTTPAALSAIDNSLRKRP